MANATVMKTNCFNTVNKSLSDTPEQTKNQMVKYLILLMIPVEMQRDYNASLRVG